MKNYYTLKKPSEVSFVEKRSQFIGFAAPVGSQEQALDFIAAIRKKHGNARHIVYAYSIKANNISRFTDDGEPSGTAGLPALEILRHEELFDTVVVVVRYFGGILLGTGGLTRAYSTAAKLAIDAAERVEVVIQSPFSLCADYSDYQRLQSVFNDFSVNLISVEYTDNVTIHGEVAAAHLKELADTIKNLTNGRIDLVL